jgi:hypothetical protein
MTTVQNNKSILRFSLLQLNIIGYLLFVIVSIFAKYFDFSIVRYVESFLLIFTIFVLGGLNIAAVLQVLTDKVFSRLEFLNIAAVGGIILVPIINLFEISFLGEYHQFIVVLNSVVFYLIAFLLKKYFTINNTVENNNPIFNLWKSDKKVFLFFGFVFLIYAGVVGLVVTAYYALPDFDPYYWMSRTQACVADRFNPGCFSERYLYEGLNLLFTYSSKIDIYAYFKYVFPFISLVLIFPALLVAKSAKTVAGKMVIALLPLCIPSTLLYLLTPMPQAMAIVLSFYFLYWLSYSYLSGNKLFYYLAGAMTAFIFWYHEVGIFFLIIWFIVEISYSGKKIFFYLRFRKIVSILLMLLLLLSMVYLKAPYNFAVFWIKNISSSFHLAPNFMFPASYVNIDGNNMGWPGVIGVAKYYLFYVGPLLLVLFVYSTYCVLKEKKQLIQKIKMISISREMVILSVAFSFFFAFAEVMPRLLNYSFLPERVWIFAGITILFILFLILRDWETNLLMRYGLLCCVFIGIVGAIYVNHQKSFMLPNYRLNAAKWIRENLPGERILLSRGDKNLLQYFTQSRYYIMPETFFCDNDVINKDGVWNYFSSGMVSYSPKKESVESGFRKEFEDYSNNNELLTIAGVQSISAKYAALSIYGDNQLGKEDLVTSGYIYFYRDDPRNPYANRPYYKKNSICKTVVFDSQPNSFELIYNDNEMVKIWKIIK